MSSSVLRFYKLKTTVRLFSSAGPSKSKEGTTTAAQVNTASNATPKKVLGPGASKEGVYKNPEYYSYNPMSHYDIEKDMKPYRLKQPSSKQ